jgi:hypothetical protein
MLLMKFAVGLAAGGLAAGGLPLASTGFPQDAYSVGIKKSSNPGRLSNR